MANKNKIYLLPAVQYNNTGDVLINKILIEELRIYGDLIVNDKGFPNWFIEELGVKENERFSNYYKDNFFEGIRISIDNNKNIPHFLVIHPGHTSRQGWKTALLSDHGILKTIKYFNLRRKGLKFLRFGFSIGPFDIFNTISESFYTRVFSYYGVRDTKSLTLAKNAKFHKPQLMPDLAWKYTFDKESEKKENYIVLSFRSGSFGTKHNSENLIPVISELKTIISSLNQNYKIKVVYQVLYDKEGAEEIYKDLKANDFNVELINEKLNLEAASKLYKNADLLISNRLHVILLGLVQGIPAFPLVREDHNQKIINIFTDNNLHEYLLYIGDNSNNVKKIESILNNEVENNRLKILIQENSKSIENVFQNVFQKKNQS